jgi:hypothetical protein
MTESILQRLREKFRQQEIKRRLKAAFRRKPRPGRVIQPNPQCALCLGHGSYDVTGWGHYERCEACGNDDEVTR